MNGSPSPQTLQTVYVCTEPDYRIHSTTAETYHTPGETRHCRRTKKKAHYIMHRNLSHTNTHTHGTVNMDKFFNESDLTNVIIEQVSTFSVFIRDGTAKNSRLRQI